MSGEGEFVRDRFTLLGYGALGVFAMAMAALGPVMPLLRGDLGISRSVGGLHFTALAAGSAIAGITSPRVVATIGRRTAMLAGGTGVAAGSLAVFFGTLPVLTIGGTLVFGTCGNVVLIVIHAALSDRHGAARSTAITEAGALMSLVFLVPGIVVGGLESFGPGWRYAFLIPVAAWAVLAVPLGRTPVPSGGPQTRRRDGELLPEFRPAYWGLMIAIAVEWSIAGWAAGYLVDEGGLSESAAAAVAVVFYMAMMIGRFGGVPLSRRLPVATMLPGAVVLTALGFPIFWLGGSPVLIVTGLAVTGLGVATLFPLLTSAMLEAAPGMSDHASSRISLAGGVAVMVAPLTLGAWADRSSLRVSMSGVVVLLVVLVGTVWWWRTIATRDEASP